MFTRPMFDAHAMNRLSREMDRLFGEVVGAAEHVAQAAAGPAVNAWETNEGLVVEMELPGLALTDLDITLHEKQLVVRGERKAPAGEAQKVHRQERAAGKFERTLALPFDVEADKVAAKLVDGVLTVTLPKAAHAQPRKITVQS